ncbi:MAG: hypothetical protein AAB554_01835 [Patescibacteria group bacterium]
MQTRSANRFVYATLIDLGFDPNDPEILLETGLDHPVDWDAVDAEGGVICKRLDFVLTVDHARFGGEPIGIHFVYSRVVRDHGVHGGLYVYALGLRPTRDKDGRDCDRLALETAVNESRNVRGRSWCADIGQVKISWRHAPKDVICVDNGAFEPEAPDAEKPRATEDEIMRACADFDSFCDGIEAPELVTIPLDERSIEFDIDFAHALSTDPPP